MVNIEMVTTRISVPDDDPRDIEVVVKREDDLVIVGFYGYTSTVSEKRYGWEVHLTPEKADLLLRGLQDLGGPARRSDHLASPAPSEAGE
jgi:hypothetical protein